MFFLDLECLSLYVLVVQYFCQWLHYDNLWKIRTFEKPDQPELWKTALRGWSFITSEWELAILLSGQFQNLDCFGGSFSEKEALPRGSFYEKWYKEIFSCYISKEINVRYNINFLWGWNYSERLACETWLLLPWLCPINSDRHELEHSSRTLVSPPMLTFLGIHHSIIPPHKCGGGMIAWQRP